MEEKIICARCGMSKKNWYQPSFGSCYEGKKHTLKKNEKTIIRRYTVDICDDCINLKGEMCHNPNCAFCRKTMKEVDTFLEGTMIKADIAQYKQKGKIIRF